MSTFNDSEKWQAARVASGVARFIPKDCRRQQMPGAIAQLFAGRAGAAEEERP